MVTDAKSFLLYYYYGGMVYLAMKQYENALFTFQVVCSKFIIVILTAHFCIGETLKTSKFSSLKSIQIFFKKINC